MCNCGRVHERETTCGHPCHYAHGLCKSCYGFTPEQRASRKSRCRKHNIRRYNMTQERYEKLLAEQGGVCAICRKFNTFRTTPHMTIDHSHITGGVRGVLCAKCNTGLGGFRDNPELLWRAIKYLEIKR